MSTNSKQTVAGDIHSITCLCGKSKHRQFNKENVTANPERIKN